PFVLKAGDSLAKVMQPHQAGNPASNMLALQPQRLSGPIQCAHWLMSQHPFGHRRHIQQMRQHTMAKTITTLCPETTGLVAEIGESFHQALLGITSLAGTTKCQHSPSLATTQGHRCFPYPR